MEKDKLKKFCKRIGIDCIGIAGVGPYYDLKKILQDRSEKDFLTGMEEECIEKRINPKLTMNNANSIIVCAFPYFLENVNDSNLSKYCFGKDYHIVVKEKLQQIANYLSNEINDFEYMIFADNGPLVDRYLANISGIGYYGINNNIITDEYGSFIFIGYIINNYKFEPDKRNEKTCIKCGKCIKACPGKAILGNFEMNPKNCLSYITQKKEDLTDFEKELLKNNKKVFGCDICQDVCPHNKDILKTNIKEFKQDLMYKLEKQEIDEISNKEFKRKYREKAFSWRGKKIIKRNIDIIEG